MTKFSRLPMTTWGYLPLFVRITSDARGCGDEVLINVPHIMMMNAFSPEIRQ